MSDSGQFHDDKTFPTNNVSDERSNWRYNVQAGLLLGGVAVMSAGAGFGATLGAVRRKERDIVSSAGFQPAQAGEAFAYEAGTRLAVRALGYGTLLAIGGVSAIAFGIWKLSGAKNFVEFREKMGTILPRIPKKQSPGKSEFESLQDFIDYVSKSPGN